jgi:hypothetical protein
VLAPDLVLGRAPLYECIARFCETFIEMKATLDDCRREWQSALATRRQLREEAAAFLDACGTTCIAVSVPGKAGRKIRFLRQVRGAAKHNAFTAARVADALRGLTARVIEDCALQWMLDVERPQRLPRTQAYQERRLRSLMPTRQHPELGMHVAPLIDVWVDAVHHAISTALAARPVMVTLHKRPERGWQRAQAATAPAVTMPLDSDAVRDWSNAQETLARATLQQWLGARLAPPAGASGQGGGGAGAAASAGAEAGDTGGSALPRDADADADAGTGAAAEALLRLLAACVRGPDGGALPPVQPMDDARAEAAAAGAALPQGGSTCADGGGRGPGPFRQPGGRDRGAQRRSLFAQPPGGRDDAAAAPRRPRTLWCDLVPFAVRHAEQQARLRQEKQERRQRQQRSAPKRQPEPWYSNAAVPAPSSPLPPSPPLSPLHGGAEASASAAATAARARHTLPRALLLPHGRAVPQDLVDRLYEAEKRCKRLFAERRLCQETLRALRFDAPPVTPRAPWSRYYRAMLEVAKQSPTLAGSRRSPAEPFHYIGLARQSAFGEGKQRQRAAALRRHEQFRHLRDAIAEYLQSIRPPDGAHGDEDEGEDDDDDDDDDDADHPAAGGASPSTRRRRRRRRSRRPSGLDFTFSYVRHGSGAAVQSRDLQLTLYKAERSDVPKSPPAYRIKDIVRYVTERLFDALRLPHDCPFAPTLAQCLMHPAFVQRYSEVLCRGIADVLRAEAPRVSHIGLMRRRGMPVPLLAAPPQPLVKGDCDSTIERRTAAAVTAPQADGGRGAGIPTEGGIAPQTWPLSLAVPAPDVVAAAALPRAPAANAVDERTTSPLRKRARLAPTAPASHGDDRDAGKQMERGEGAG